MELRHDRNTVSSPFRFVASSAFIYAVSWPGGSFSLRTSEFVKIKVFEGLEDSFSSR